MVHIRPLLLCSRAYNSFLLKAISSRRSGSNLPSAGPRAERDRNVYTRKADVRLSVGHSLSTLSVMQYIHLKWAKNIAMTCFVHCPNNWWEDVVNYRLKCERCYVI